MGCTSSSLSFRDVFIDLQQRWELDPRVYGVFLPENFEQRSSVFVSCASDTARQASQWLPSRGGSLFTCDPLLVEQSSLLTHSLYRLEGNDKLHPYNAILFRRLLAAVPEEHARYSDTKVLSIVEDGSFITRWDYRVWMVACCEFYHVLAILQEQKALPETLKTFMNAFTGSAKRKRLLQASKESTELYQNVLDTLWRKGSTAQCTTSTLSTSVLRQLQSEIPSIEARTRNSMSSTIATTSGNSEALHFIELAKEYEARMILKMDLDEMNPLHSSGSVSVPSSVSLLVFAEWVAIDCALFFHGQEDDFMSYGVLPKPPSGTLPQKMENLRQQWRAQLLRLSKVEHELAEVESLGPISEVYQQLLAKMNGMEAQIKEKISEWRGGREFLTAEHIEDISWNLLGVEESLPNRAVHQVLSRRAFECVVGTGSTISTTSELCQYLRYYLALHDLYCDVVSQQSKRLGPKGSSNESCLPTCIDVDIIDTALVAAQARQDICLDPTPAVAAGRVLLTRALVLDVLRELFDYVGKKDSSDGMKYLEWRSRDVDKPLRDTEDLPEVEEDGVRGNEDELKGVEDRVEDEEVGVKYLEWGSRDVDKPLRDTEDLPEVEDNRPRDVESGALSKVLVQDFIPVSHVSPTQCFIDELRRTVGIGNPKQQRLFIASFLRNLFALNHEDFVACSPELAAKALETAADLPHFTHHSACVAAVVIRYVILRPSDWLAFSAGDDIDSAALTKWLYWLRAESLDRLALLKDPAHIEFFVHTTFCVAAAYCFFENTAPEANTSESSEVSCDEHQFTGVRPLLTGVTAPHFVRGVTVISKYLECPVEVLLNNSQALFLAASNDEERLITQAAGPEFSVESAFRSCRSVAHLAAHWHECNSEADEPNAHDGAETVNVLHVLFIMAFNYTRQHCSTSWGALTCYDNDLHAFPKTEERYRNDYPKWQGEEALLDLSSAMPLHTLVNCYQDFTQLTEQEAPPDRPAEGSSGAQAAFLHAFYVQYMCFFQRLCLDEDHVKEVGTQALQYLAGQSPRRSSDKRKLGITRREFSSFLQFILGYFMTEKAYQSVVRPRTAVMRIAMSTPSEVFLSEKEFGCILACFGQFTKGGPSSIPTLEDAHLWLTSRRVADTDKGFISLQNALLWYSSYRADHYALKSLYDLWRDSYALRIPFMTSAAHSQERQSAMREILRRKQHCVGLSESYPVEVLEHEDGYLPIEITFAVWQSRWKVGDVSERIFSDEDQKGVLSSTVDREGAQKTASPPSVPLWLVSCQRWLSELLDRPDYELLGVHYSDFRFFLQYVHHFISAYISLCYALALCAVCPDAVSADGSARRFFITPREDGSALTELFSMTLIPLVRPFASVSEVAVMLSSIVTEILDEMRITGIVTDEICRRTAHTVAYFLVKDARSVACTALSPRVERIHPRDLPATITSPTVFFGGHVSYNSSEKLSYWERLRLLLPFGTSLLHRQRRRELFTWMDHHQCGYLTMSDIARGLINMVQLQTFRADFTPALLRAFRGTKDLKGEPRNLVYLTEHTEEQVLLPWELKAFLAYLYRYLELYFMFDVLTCSGYVNPETLHVEQKRQSYPEDDTDGARPSAARVVLRSDQSADAAVDASAATSGSAEAPHMRSASDALYEASTRPYQITLEAAPMKKEVSLEQFKVARDLLRRWGADVERPGKVFQRISQRYHREGKLVFNRFVIYASAHGIRPEGYDYGSDASISSVAHWKEGHAFQ